MSAAMNKVVWCLAALVVVLLLARPALAQSQYTITALFQNPGTGSYPSGAAAINDNNQVALTGYATNNLGVEENYAFFWSQSTGLVNCRTLVSAAPPHAGNDSTSVAYGIGPNGQVVGSSAESYQGGFPGEGFIWNSGTIKGIQLPSGNYGVGVAEGINSSGVAVGWAQDEYTVPHAFYYENGVSTPIGNQPNPISDNDDYACNAEAINASGQITGMNQSTSSPYNDDVALWVGTTTYDLGFAGYGYAINASGEIVGQTSGQKAFAWTPTVSNGTTGTEQVLNGLTNTSESAALSINSSGVIVGWSTASDGTKHAVIWNGSTTPTDLNTLIPTNSGWTLTEATGINGSGYIVGYGFASNSNGNTALLLT